MFSYPSYHVSYLNEEIVIVASTDESFSGLVQNAEEFFEDLSLCKEEKAQIRSITIIGGDQRKVTVPIKEMQKAINRSNAMIVHQSPTVQIPTIEDMELLTEILSYEGSAAAVRFHDDKGLFSNQRIELTSGLRPNDWQGKTMSSYWIEEELSRFKRALLKDGRVSGYEYVAHLMTGAKAAYKVDARLAFYRGDLIRIVKNIIPAQVMQ